MRTRLPLLFAALLVVGCGDDSDPGSDAGPPGLDAGPAADAGPATDAGGALDAGEAADAGGTDAGGDTDAGAGTTPEYDAEGCLTFESASFICGFRSDGAACGRLTSCGIGDMSQCQIDCEMATTLCLGRELVDACIAAFASEDCDRIRSDCNGWVVF